MPPSRRTPPLHVSAPSEAGRQTTQRRRRRGRGAVLCWRSDRPLAFCGAAQRTTPPHRTRRPAGNKGGRPGPKVNGLLPWEPAPAAVEAAERVLWRGGGEPGREGAGAAPSEPCRPCGSGSAGSDRPRCRMKAVPLCRRRRVASAARSPYRATGSRVRLPRRCSVGSGARGRIDAGRARATAANGIDCRTSQAAVGWMTTPAPSCDLRPMRRPWLRQRSGGERGRRAAEAGDERRGDYFRWRRPGVPSRRLWDS